MRPTLCQRCKTRPPSCLVLEAGDERAQVVRLCEPCWIDLEGECPKCSRPDDACSCVSIDPNFKPLTLCPDDGRKIRQALKFCPAQTGNLHDAAVISILKYHTTYREAPDVRF